MIFIRSANIADARRVALRLRRSDLQEIKANLGEDPFVVLERGIVQSSPSYAVVNEADQALALFGVVPDTGDADVGLVWLLASDELARHPFFVLRNTRKWVEILNQQYRVLWNHIDARNELHLRWLRWSGFTLLRRIENFGVEQRPFYEFEKVRSDPNTEATKCTSIRS
jgi:hypothetical protein